MLDLFEREAPEDGRPRDAVKRAEAFARGESDAASQIRMRFVAGRAASAVRGPTAVAAARAAAQASGVAHMGAHALGAAAYAVVAAARAGREIEVGRLLDDLDDRERAALRLLPAVGSDGAGPLAPGSLLDRGELGDAIRAIQAALQRD